MRYSLASLALAAVAYASPTPQGVTSAIAPSSSTPAGCSTSHTGTFEIAVVNVSSSTTKRSAESLAKRDALVVSLSDSILTDAEGRTGYIASNYQFQFDKPAQAGAIYTAGWSICSNGTLALGGSALFYQCLSGTFYNLYDEDVAAQCNAVYIYTISTTSSATTAALSINSDGQATGTAVSQISDGQIQATTAVVSQISDGQIQATTSTPAVSQISDGQIQATASVSTTSKAAATVAVASDGQITASAGTNSTITTASASATKASSTTVAPLTATGGAALIRGEFFGLAAGVLAVAML